MADPFVAEIRIFPFNFAPRGWAFCNGQLLPISQNTALFSLLGTTYGGDGKSTFALPDLRERPMHPGQGPGLSLHDLGRDWAVARRSRCSRARSRAHTARDASAQRPGPGERQDPPNPRRVVRASHRAARCTRPTGNAQPRSGRRSSPAGGEHAAQQPDAYLTLNFCIALQGVFPPRA